MLKSDIQLPDARILFIDDQPEIRLETAKRFYAKHFNIVAFDTIPYIPDDFEGYDVISFDNDLGGSPEADTYVCLSRKLYQGELDLSGKKVIVHSMNVAVSNKICIICKDAGATYAQMIAYSEMVKS
jgi:hypothetical protein